jgi:hypothetical protein
MAEARRGAGTKNGGGRRLKRSLQERPRSRRAIPSTPSRENAPAAFAAALRPWVGGGVGLDAVHEIAAISEMESGEGGIRTPDTVTRMPHFECGAFNHSATSPSFEIAVLFAWPNREHNDFATNLLPSCHCYRRCCSRFCIAAASTSLTRSAASACIPGITCEYRSSVIAIELCPSRSWAIFG